MDPNTPTPSLATENTTNRKYLYPLLLAAVLMVLGIILNFIKPHEKQNSIQTSSARSENVLHSIAEQLQKDPRFSGYWTRVDTGRMVWRGAESPNIVIDSVPSLVLKVPSSMSPESMVQTFSQYLAQAASERNMQSSASNSYQADAETGALYQNGYEDDDHICTVVSDPTVQGTAYESSIQCATRQMYESAQSVQLPFLQALGATAADDRTVSNVRVGSRGNIAVVTVGSARGTSSAAEGYFYRPGSEWILIGQFQDIPGCDTFSEKNIPEEYWLSCYGQKSDGTYNGEPMRTPGAAWDEFSL
jgi:hypothetical protein